jgi:hypothetical protein
MIFFLRNEAKRDNHAGSEMPCVHLAAISGSCCCFEKRGALSFCLGRQLRKKVWEMFNEILTHSGGCLLKMNSFNSFKENLLLKLELFSSFLKCAAAAVELQISNTKLKAFRIISFLL